jgi:hypothetical protein
MNTKSIKYLQYYFREAAVCCMLKNAAKFADEDLKKLVETRIISVGGLR